jgi:hypothetical protein
MDEVPPAGSRNDSLLTRPKAAGDGPGSGLWTRFESKSYSQKDAVAAL